MPDLSKSLQGKDLGHLRIVAELWGESLGAADLRSGLERLVSLLLDRERAAEVIGDLPTEARSALDALARRGGRMSWALFARRYGQVREMGAARRDRERPYLKPVSPVEMLWYRALVGRAFFDSPTGLEEFAYIPDDLLPYLPPLQQSGPAPLGRPASPLERAHPLPARDHVLDHACTLLAALRMGLPMTELAAQAAGWQMGPQPLAVETLHRLLQAAGLLDEAGMPVPEPARDFLEAGRGQALHGLVRSWLNSSLFNELHLMPTLKIEGNWDNDPLRARRAILDFLSTTAAEDEGETPFWSLAAFVDAIHQQHPDFQRPAGDYDSWFIRDARSEVYLRGFEHWSEVDGALVRFMISGPLYWLGIVDLAFAVAPAEKPDAPPSAFRISAWGKALLAGRVPEGLPIEDAPILARSDALLIAPRLAPRSLRYQVARFGVWEAEKPEAYPYRLTPASLARARQGGLSVNHLLNLLRRSARAIPPSLVKALERWERLGVEMRIQQLTVLRLANPELLQIVRASKAGRFLGDPLGPTSVIVKGGAAQKVMTILAEMGYLGQASILDEND